MKYNFCLTRKDPIRWIKTGRSQLARAEACPG